MEDEISNIVYPNQIRPITENLSADELIRRLKVSKKLVEKFSAFYFFYGD